MKSFLKKIITKILELEARAIIKKYKPTIIAITGSVGKTSTKDAIYSVLASTTAYVRKSEKSFNSEIGVPLTILGCNNAWSDPFLWISNILHGLELIFLKAHYPDCLVLEVGADHPGDIQRAMKIFKPDISVVTKVSLMPVHVEFFPSPEAVLVEKGYLVKGLKKTGTAILSQDDEGVLAMGNGITQKVITFGLSSSATISSSNIMTMYEVHNGNRVPVGISFKLNHGGSSFPVMVRGVLGVQHIYPLLAAAAVGISQGILFTDIIESLSAHIAPPGRMNILQGINDSTLIDDTYNSSPDALREALSALAALEVPEGSRKIAILGDMLELGKFSGDEHKKAGELARQAASLIVTVGQRAKVMGNTAFDTSEEAAEYMKDKVQKGDIVLIKGSQGIRMEKIVKALLLEPEKAGKLLVRQEEEWLAKK